MVNKYTDLLAEDYFNSAFKFYEDVNVTKMLKDAGISIGMDFDPIVIIQVIGKKTKSFANIRCYKEMSSGARICVGKYGMFRDCNMRIEDMFLGCKRTQNVYHKIYLPEMPPTIKAEVIPNCAFQVLCCNNTFITCLCDCRNVMVEMRMKLGNSYCS
ncbi:unnamed protein product [Prunus brigantina]